MTPIAEISGRNFKVIENAAAEFLQKKPDVGEWSILHYEISVFQKDDRFIVVFRQAGLDPDFRGSPEGFPGFEVEIAASSLSVTKAYFVR